MKINATQTKLLKPLARDCVGEAYYDKGYYWLISLSDDSIYYATCLSNGHIREIDPMMEVDLVPLRIEDDQ